MEAILREPSRTAKIVLKQLKLLLVFISLPSLFLNPEEDRLVSYR